MMATESMDIRAVSASFGMRLLSALRAENWRQMSLLDRECRQLFAAQAIDSLSPESATDWLDALADLRQTYSVLETELDAKFGITVNEISNLCKGQRAAQAYVGVSAAG